MTVQAFAIAATLVVALSGPAFAQGGTATPENTASPGKEADKMKAGDAAGSAPNSSNPGANPSADGNKTQDSRTTKDKQR